MQGIFFPYDAQRAAGLIGAVMRIFSSGKPADESDIILNDRAIIIPPMLPTQKTQIIPFADIYQVSSLNQRHNHQILIRFVGGRTTISHRGMRFGDFEHLNRELRVRVQAAGGGEMGLF